MKRISIGLVLVISLIFPSSSPVNAAVKAGATCKKEKQIIISNNYLYQINSNTIWQTENMIGYKPINESDNAYRITTESVLDKTICLV